MQEQRQAERIRSFLRAQIVFNNRMSTIDCIIKNISQTGAKVALNESLTVPTEFEIDIPQKGRSHRARLVWRDKDAIGIQFTDSKPLMTSPTPQVGLPSAATAQNMTPEHRVDELTLQNAELKAQIRRLRKRLEDLGQDPDARE
jgi:hypothetical protein